MRLGVERDRPPAAPEVDVEIVQRVLIAQVRGVRLGRSAA
jgi:hypothetical protein